MEIRQAKIDDKGPIFELIYSAGKELYDFVFKTKSKTALEFIRFEYYTGKGFCGYRNITVAIENNRVVGTGCFYDGRLYFKLVFGTIKNMFKFYGFFKAWPVLRRMTHITSVMKKPKNDELYLANFGVKRDLRGKGVGSYLINFKRNEARKNGYRILSLDVNDTNQKAEKLYNRLGFQVVEQKKFSGSSSFPIYMKMELLLEGKPSISKVLEGTEA